MGNPSAKNPWDPPSSAGQSLSTQDGRVEILLTPGIFFRVDNHSSVRMISPGLADTVLELQNGRAMVEVADIRPENNVRVGEGSASTQLLKAGLYDFDADRGQIRVLDGKAVVQIGGQQIEVKSGHQLNLNATGKLKARKFDKKADRDDFYRWGSLRSSYLAEANVDAARTYGGGGGWSPANWYGNGWYWDPSFDTYTFIPGDGIFFDPFGWGFYSPWYAYGAPYFGYGYGYGYGGVGYLVTSGRDTVQHTLLVVAPLSRLDTRTALAEAVSADLAVRELSVAAVADSVVADSMAAGEAVSMEVAAADTAVDGSGSKIVLSGLEHIFENGCLRVACRCTPLRRSWGFKVTETRREGG